MVPSYHKLCYLEAPTLGVLLLAGRIPFAYGFRGSGCWFCGSRGKSTNGDSIAGGGGLAGSVAGVPHFDILLVVLGEGREPLAAGDERG